MRTLPYNQTHVTEKLIIVNAVVFLLTSVVQNLQYYLALIPSFILHGYIWQFVTYMFVHGSVSHLFFNMLSLFIFGSVVERQLGSREFLLFYLVTGTFSGILSFLSYLLAGTNVVLVGASGAIYAILLLFAVFNPYAQIFVFGLIPIRAPILVLVYTGIELYSQVFAAGGNVAHLTHLFGLLGAYLYCLVRLKISPLKVFKDSLN
jgi:membrane associated rhomboid family serine protease